MGEDGARCVCSAEGDGEEVQKKEGEKKTEQKEDTGGKEDERK